MLSKDSHIKLLIFTLIVPLFSVLTSGQQLQTSAGIVQWSAAGNTTVCATSQNGTTAPQTSSCPNTPWSDGIGGSGSGAATITTSYAVVRASANSTVSETVSTAAGTETQAQAAADFSDYLTFPALSTPAFLKGFVTVSGSESGDPHSTVQAALGLNGSTSNNCQVQSVKGSCSTSIPISPGDRPNVQGTFQMVADSLLNPGTGSSSAALNLAGKQKNNGVTYGFVVTDSAGHDLKVPIVAASGTTYPTR